MHNGENTMIIPQVVTKVKLQDAIQILGRPRVAKDPSGLETETYNKQRGQGVTGQYLLSGGVRGPGLPARGHRCTASSWGIPQSSPGKDKQGPPQAGHKCPGQERHLGPPGVSWTQLLGQKVSKLSALARARGVWELSTRASALPPCLSAHLDAGVTVSLSAHLDVGVTASLSVCTPGCWNHCLSVCICGCVESLCPCLHTWLLDPLLFSRSSTKFITAPPHQLEAEWEGVTDSTHHLHCLIFSSWPLWSEQQKPHCLSGARIPLERISLISNMKNWSSWIAQNEKQRVLNDLFDFSTWSQL